jgi:hypothetical protein
MLQITPQMRVLVATQPADSDSGFAISLWCGEVLQRGGEEGMKAGVARLGTAYRNARLYDPAKVILLHRLGRDPRPRKLHVQGAACSWQKMDGHAPR